MTTSLNSQQYDGGVGIDGEGRQHHFVQDVVLYPTQLLGQFPGREAAADGGPLLAGRDQLEGTLQGLLQVLQRAGHRRAVGHRAGENRGGGGSWAGGHWQVGPGCQPPLMFFLFLFWLQTLKIHRNSQESPKNANPIFLGF